jgi:uncharacterized membrane protein YoaK (UPF0700 family)
MVGLRITLPQLQSLLAGYVDTAGFLALQGLFTAHVTGNFVTLGASLVLGTSGVVAKLLALPVFCLVIVLIRTLSFQLPKAGLPILPTLLTLKAALLATGAALAISLGPFRDGDSAGAILTGMVLVAAMAIQNSAHRAYYAASPPTTIMTGTTTQMMIDLADLLRPIAPADKTAAQARLGLMARSVAAFAIGCAAGATLFGVFGKWCFALPPLLALISLSPAVLKTVARPPAPPQSILSAGKGP